jgi:short-subunit dehydrogenase
VKKPFPSRRSSKRKAARRGEENIKSAAYHEGMQKSFENRVVLITGASSGIGRALALVLAKSGAKLGLVARRKDLLDQLAAETGGAIAIAPADVSIRAEMQAASQAIRERLGPIDYLIANAGVGTPTLLDPPNVRDIERMFQVNVFGVIYAIEAVLPEMLKRKSGHIAAVSSIAAFKGLPGESAYCASKAAVNTYLEGLRIQLRDYLIPVTVCCPGFVETPMTAVNNFHMPFLMSAERAADHILWAVRKRKKVYRFPRPMSWLIRLTAWAPDWIVARTMKGYNETPPMSDLGK